MLLAPGTDMIFAGSPQNPRGYATGDGTSSATTYASASAALRADFPDLTAGQIVNRLTKTASVPDSEKGMELPDEKYGYGSIRPLAALTEDIPKGSRYGPLSVPAPLRAEGGTADSGDNGASDDSALEAQQGQKQTLLLVITAVVGVALLAATVLTIVLVRRKKKNRPGGPGNWGPPNSQATGGYGQPPHQQQTGQHAPPQQPPYQP